LSRRVAIFLLCCSAAWAQSRNPRFQDFPPSEIFNGKPAPPRLATARDRQFRSRIREGAATGPNFAGHYTIVEWGCGAGCVSMTLVDAKNGTILPVPFDVLGLGANVLKYESTILSNADGFQPLSYKKDSRLLIARGCPGQKNCASYFYELTAESKFKLISKTPAITVTPP